MTDQCVDAGFKEKVKRNVADNFDQSCRQYVAFEKRHRFFRTLALKLAEHIDLQPGTDVLDVGCGNGISALALNEQYACRVLGIDLSAEMVATGRSVCTDPDIQLVVGDGEHLVELAAGRKFDYTLYNASIFIFPDVDRTMQEAYACLRPGGKMAFSFYPAVVDRDGNDLLGKAFSRLGEPAPRFRVITDYTRASQALETLCGRITHYRWERPLDLAFLNDFFSIPAQSTSLFPGLEYDARIPKVRALLDTLTGETRQGKIVWRMAEGIKASDAPLP